jgi:hypothetical protein
MFVIRIQKTFMLPRRGKFFAGDCYYDNVIPLEEMKALVRNGYAEWVGDAPVDGVAKVVEAVPAKEAVVEAVVRKRGRPRRDEGQGHAV